MFRCIWCYDETYTPKDMPSGPAANTTNTINTTSVCRVRSQSPPLPVILDCHCYHHHYKHYHHHHHYHCFRHNHHVTTIYIHCPVKYCYCLRLREALVPLTTWTRAFLIVSEYPECPPPQTRRSREVSAHEDSLTPAECPWRRRAIFLPVPRIERLHSPCGTTGKGRRDMDTPTLDTAAS